MAAEPAARVEDALPDELVSSDRVEPVEELSLELRVQLRKMLPLPAECGCRLSLLLDEVRGNEPGDPTANRPMRAARVTDELSGSDIRLRGLCDELELVAGKGADEVFE